MSTMVTIKFETSLVTLMRTLAKQKHKSINDLAKELMLEALEDREDQALSALADARDKTIKKRKKHNETWMT
jgi:hypothetical protein